MASATASGGAIFWGVLVCGVPAATAAGRTANYIPPARRPPRYRPPAGATQAARRAVVNLWRQAGMPRHNGAVAVAPTPPPPYRRNPSRRQGVAAPGLEGGVGHDSAGGRFGEFDSIERFGQHRDVRRYLRVPHAAAGANPFQDAVELWWNGPDLCRDGSRPLSTAQLVYMNGKGAYKVRKISAPGRAVDFPANLNEEAQRRSPVYAAYTVALSQSRAAAACLVEAVGLASGKTLGQLCAGEAASAECAWTLGIAALRRQAMLHGSVHDLHHSTFLAAYLLRCHVGCHRDARDCAPELICERFTAQMASLSPQARAAVLASRTGSTGRVITPEFGMRWVLRPCRDIAHMHWGQVAHVSPRLGLAQQIYADAGGGVLKYVGS